MESLRRRFGSSLHWARPMATVSAAVPLSISLTLPPPITHDLLQLGLSSAVAERVSDEFVRSAYALREAVHVNARRTWTSLTEGNRQGLPSVEEVRDKLIDAFQALYDRDTDDYRAKCIERVKDRIQSLLTQNTNTRTTFSSVSVSLSPCGRHLYPIAQIHLPLLEGSFRTEPNPGRVAKEDLAKQTNMTYRQIQVWVSEGFFQAHRHELMEATIGVPKPSHSVQEYQACALWTATRPHCTHCPETFHHYR